MKIAKEKRGVGSFRYPWTHTWGNRRRGNKEVTEGATSEGVRDCLVLLPQRQRALVGSLTRHATDSDESKVQSQGPGLGEGDMTVRKR